MLPQEGTTITIARDGGLYLAGERLDLSQLAARLKAFGARQPVIIRADTETDYKRVVEVVDACKAAAASRISLATAGR
jgi:biopolymer transport protein ExbD